MSTNLFPAILIAGPPNCGKSVLSFMLTLWLRKVGAQHYLLRAAPDGEGDWFFQGEAAAVRLLRMDNKTKFSDKFTSHMRSTVEHRLLPLLVDIGGRPQGDQFSIINACTHSILLYKTNEELTGWRDRLAEYNLLPIAELHSQQLPEESLVTLDRIDQVYPILRGDISGLERDEKRRQMGMTFGALLDRTAGICHYEPAFLEQEHLRHAPLPYLTERTLAKKLGLEIMAGRPLWLPEHLKGLPQFVLPGCALALYGPGPVWLAAAVAALTLPAEVALFDVRFGWLDAPKIRYRGRPNVNVHISACSQLAADWMSIRLPEGIKEPGEIFTPPLKGDSGIILSGRIPRWLYAGLSRRLANERAWVGIYDPKLDRIVIVHSNSPSVQVGDTLNRAELANN